MSERTLGLIGRAAALVAIVVVALLSPSIQAGAKKTTDEPVPVGSVIDGAPAPTRPATVDRCETCHGIDGNSLHFDFPRLAGQRKDYLLKQMRDIKAGRRKVDVMVPVLSTIDEAQMVELADWFSSIPLVQGSSANPSSAKIGKKIFDLGLPYRMVAQCSACHGSFAEGRLDPGLIQDGFGGFPALNGQHPAYTTKQLKAFRDGSRANDFNGMMRNLAKNMTDQEIALVADYLAGMELPPELPVAVVTSVAAPPQAAACVGCHGPSGNSVSPIFPKLAGQQEAYMLKQLSDMKSGARKVPMMEKLIEPMTTADFEAIARYFVAQTPTTTPTTASPEVAARGLTIFFEGTPKVLACYSCHNFDGRGSEDFGLSPGGYPMLFGQHSTYLVKQLKDFKSAARKNDHVSAMRNIAAQMSDEDIEAVSAFLQEMKY